MFNKINVLDRKETYFGESPRKLKIDFFLLFAFGLFLKDATFGTSKIELLMAKKGFFSI